MNLQLPDSLDTLALDPWFYQYLPSSRVAGKGNEMYMYLAGVLYTCISMYIVG